TETVAPVPRIDGRFRIRLRDVRAPMEVRELPGPTRERAQSNTGRKIQMAMAEGEIVAGLRRVEDDVTVQRESTEISPLGVDDRRADLDRIDVRGLDRAEVTGLAPVRPAVLRHMEFSASRRCRRGDRAGRGRRQTGRGRTCAGNDRA